MPVTFFPSNKPRSTINTGGRGITESDELLHATCTITTRRECGPVIQSTFARHGGPANSGQDSRAILPVPHGNGFVGTALMAYNGEHHLVLRPDDVWMAILSQFSLYVQANSEQLSHLFVQHDGKRTLSLPLTDALKPSKSANWPPFEIDFSVVPEKFADLVQANVLDKGLKKWFLPSFSTTTDDDRIVASVLLMATSKNYFYFLMDAICGLPGVTLLGDREDWEILCSKAEGLLDYDDSENSMQTWCSLLKPVLKRFVTSFDPATSPEERLSRDQFWQCIVHNAAGDCLEPSLVSGWITAFCFFSQYGEVLYSRARLEKPPLLSRLCLFGTKRKRLEHLKLDGVAFHSISINAIPPGYADVTVTIRGGENDPKLETLFVAGVVGLEAYCGSHLGSNPSLSNTNNTGRKAHDDSSVPFDTVQPLSGWWLVRKNTAAQAEYYSASRYAYAFRRSR